MRLGPKSWSRTSRTALSNSSSLLYSLRRYARSDVQMRLIVSLPVYAQTSVSAQVGKRLGLIMPEIDDHRKPGAFAKSQSLWPTWVPAWRQLFDRGGARFGDHVVRCYERARDEDLYVTHAIVPPQIDRSQPAHRQPEPFLYPGVVAEREGGIVVRGAQAIATSAVLADWLFLSYITPLVPGDEDYALSFVVPIAAEGLRLYPRRPFAAIATSVYDYPLSSRFDEVDATVVFHDMFVPWEQVFIYR